MVACDALRDRAWLDHLIHPCVFKEFRGRFLGKCSPVHFFWGSCDLAWYSAELGEFLLRYDDVRTADNPDAVLLDFLQSTYEAAADLVGWDRAALER